MDNGGFLTSIGVASTPYFDDDLRLNLKGFELPVSMNRGALQYFMLKIHEN
jgi:hypothetical protein